MLACYYVFMSKKRLVLLDTHAIIHRAYHALPNFHTSSGEPTGALFGVVSMILNILKDLKPYDIAATYDLPKPTYRHELYEKYKATRKKAEDDLIEQINKSRELLDALSIPIYQAEGFEADDILGTLANSLKKSGDFDEIIIASGDMDTLQLVDDRKVMVYTLKRTLKDTVLYDQKAVVARFGFLPSLLPDFKGLCGDKSDNIPGVPGIGEKTAQKLVSEFGDLDNIYKALENNDSRLAKLKITPRIKNLLLEHKQEAYFSKMLATIRVDAPVTFEKQKQKWSERVDIKKAEQIFLRFEFRRPAQTLKELLGLDKDKKQESREEVDEKLLTEAKIKLWLLRSDFTDPSYEDILSFTKEKTLKKALAVLDSKIKESGLQFVWNKIEKPLIPVIEHMNNVGVLIDKVFFEKLSVEFSGRLAKLEKKIFKEAGEEFNLRSPKQLSEVLFVKMGLKPPRGKKTQTGQISTSEEVLEKIKEQHNIVDLILKYRELHKLFSTYVQPIPKMVDKNGRLHTEFVQTGTTTGRLSSRNPNLQNIPVKTEEGKRIREGFVAQKDSKLLSLDYSQIELRIAAILSGDKNLKEIFVSGGDIHTAVASRVFHVKEEEVTPAMRRRAKVINFGILYGMGITSLRKNLGEGTTLQEAREYLDSYFAHFSGLAQWIKKTKQVAHERGYTETLFGRKRYFEGINSNIPYIKAAAERMAINAPVQGTQADIIKMAMSQSFDLINKKYDTARVKLILQVHDEIIFEVQQELAISFAGEVKKIMENVLPKTKACGVPIKVNAKMGDNWGALENIDDII